MTQNYVQTCDAIIVGAGPAGNAAALQLSEAGLNAIVVDYRETIGDKLCTGVIGLECAALFQPASNIIFNLVDHFSLNNKKKKK